MKEQPMLLVFRYLAFILLFVCAGLLCLLLAGYVNDLPGEASPTSSPGNSPIRLVIDAGHGGMDGGASAEDGTLEKDINLALAEILAELADVMDIPAVMTRTEDEMLADGGSGGRKMQDLRARLTIASDYPEAALVSIHCNKFPDPRPSGLQVYYSPNHMRSRELAEALQCRARTHLDPGNTRTIKEADSSIYLLNRAHTPAILVECGFLSNPAEAVLLKDHAYRQKLAAVMLGALTAASEDQVQEE